MMDPLSNSVYRELPPDAVSLLKRVSAPPRLIAHLVLVHDVASQLVERLCETFPGVQFDAQAVLFGACTHDIGKAIDGAELAGPDEDHPRRGAKMLRKMGVAEERARFAYTHGNWKEAEDIRLEDLLVSLADKTWKGKRIDELETKTANFLSAASGSPEKSCYTRLHEILQSLAADADSRLAWQNSFSTPPLAS